VGYDLGDVEQLIEFDNDCHRAASWCPQYQGAPQTSHDGAISVAQVFGRWFWHGTLWKSGYGENLSAKAIETFQRYAMLRGGDVHDTKTHRVFGPSEAFRIKFKAYT
jgi:hypothetical protein